MYVEVYCAVHLFDISFEFRMFHVLWQKFACAMWVNSSHVYYVLLGGFSVFESFSYWRTSIRRHYIYILRILFPQNPRIP